MEKNKTRKIMMLLTACAILNYYGKQKLIGYYEKELNQLKSDMESKEIIYKRYEAKWNIIVSWKRMEQKGIPISKYFENHNYMKIAIYGLGELGELLADELHNSSIQVEYILDRNKGNQTYKNIPVINLDAKLTAVDCIVISTVKNFEEVKSVIDRQVEKFCLITLAEVIKEVEMERDWSKNDC